MSQFDKPFLRLSPTVVIKKIPSSRVDDGITIPAPRRVAVDPETAKHRIRLFITGCCSQGRIYDNEQIH